MPYAIRNTMNFLEVIANKLRNITTREEERGEYSGGYWPARVREEAIKLCLEAKGALLEVGCGEGMFIAGLAVKNPGLSISGIDNWKDIVLKAQDRIRRLGIANVLASWGAAEKLPFSDNTFDFAVCINTLFNLSSLNDVERTLRELSRVTKPKGKVIIDIRNSLNPLVLLKYGLARYYDSTLKVPVRAYSLAKINSLLQTADLRIEKKVAIGCASWLVPPIILIQARKCES